MSQSLVTYLNIIVREMMITWIEIRTQKRSLCDSTIEEFPANNLLFELRKYAPTY